MAASGTSWSNDGPVAAGGDHLRGYAGPRRGAHAARTGEDGDAVAVAAVGRRRLRGKLVESAERVAHITVEIVRKPWE